MQKNNQPTASPGCIFGKAAFSSSAPAKTIQTIISTSRNQPSGNKSERVVLSDHNDGLPPKNRAENCRAKDNINGDRTAAGTTAPATPAISFGEGGCHGLQRVASHSMYGIKHKTK